ncbi:hypothetical protein [Sphingomonas oligophenolica]|nr:hypothetical protein [Sphingomonas oligophenolica]
MRANAQDIAVPTGAERSTVAPTPKRVCRKVVATGSIMPKTICLTQDDWHDMNAKTQANADEALRHRGTGMCDINCTPGS